MPCKMKRRVTEPVAERQMMALAPRPEIVQPFDAKSLRRRVPELEMHLNRCRQLRIEVIPAPLPAGFPDHRGQVIHGQAVESADRLVAQTEQAVARRLMLARRN